MHRRAVYITFGLLVLLGCHTGLVADGDTPLGQTETFSIPVGGKERWMTVYRPQGYHAGAPVVMLLHGGTQSMQKMLKRRAGAAIEWLLLADREQFLLLIPNGTNARTGDPKGNRQNWNDLRPATSKDQPKADDVGFLLRLLDWAHAEYDYDPDRVYITGASNGGMMTMRMVLEAPERFAAAAALIATLPVSPPAIPKPGRRVPLLLMNGTKDPLVHWKGGEMPGGRGNMMPVESMVAWWRRVNNVDHEPETTTSLPDIDPKDGCRIRRSIWSVTRKQAAPVVFYKMDGGGHNTPSIKYQLSSGPLMRRVIGPQCHDVSGVDLVWDFFTSSRKRDRRD